LIAAALYGNIGIKVIYSNVLMELFNFPPLTATKGKYIWIALVPIYWALAFVVAAAVPLLGDFSSLVGAICIGNFTYTFPAMLRIGFMVKQAAMLPEETFDETTGKYTRLDNGIKRHSSSPLSTSSTFSALWLSVAWGAMLPLRL
jgi:hypothetical protein